MTSSQFAEWMAYATLEPFGEYREELRHGQRMAFEAARGGLRKRPIDFMNFTDPPAPPKPEPPSRLSHRIATELFGIRS
jgi:hypothetical protein